MNLKELESILDVPFRDLSDLTGDPAVGGILVTEGIDEKTVARYIHQQFRENAECYAVAYQAYAHFEELLRRSFGRLEFSRFDEPLTIVDIGSGAGNSVVPLLRLFPQATVMASDLSIELLVILKRELKRMGLDKRCALLQLNAETIELKPQSADVAVGAAILHHLFQPELTISRCGQILRPGGVAVFFEPFEIGNGVMRFILTKLLDDNRAKAIAPEVRKMLSGVAADIAARTGVQPHSRLEEMDDKWLFSQAAFERQATEAGFASCRIYNLLDDIECPFTAKLGTLLRLSLDLPPESLPQWAWSLVAEVEDHFSLAGRRDLIMEGAVLLRKAP